MPRRLIILQPVYHAVSKNAHWTFYDVIDLQTRCIENVRQNQLIFKHGRRSDVDERPSNNPINPSGYLSIVVFYIRISITDEAAGSYIDR